MFFGARLKPFVPLVSEHNKLRWVDLGSAISEHRRTAISQKQIPYLVKKKFVCKENPLTEIAQQSRLEMADSVLSGFRRKEDLRKVDRIPHNASIELTSPFFDLPTFHETKSFKMHKKVRQNTIFTYLQD